jgi:hypothetical protein
MEHYSARYCKWKYQNVTKTITRDGYGHECQQVEDEAKEEYGDKKKCIDVRTDGSKDIMGF